MVLNSDALLFPIMMKRRVALSIAGSDSSGGAGVQADLDAFGFLGVHGACVVTCVTAQNTHGVASVFRLPIETIASQLDAVFDDMKIAAIKTGMLYDADVVNCVTRKLKSVDVPVVVDPVLVATSGDTLSTSSLVKALKNRLLPQSFLVTANIPEASTITGVPIYSVKDMKTAGKQIYTYGVKNVIKGGHLPGKHAVDVLYDGKQFHLFSLPRIPKRTMHGSGCTLSALITGHLAQGDTVVDAVQKAKYDVWSMILSGYKPGRGMDVLDHQACFILPTSVTKKEDIALWVTLKDAVEKLVTILPSSLIPEVGTNFVYAKKKAQTPQDVCGIDGRIIRSKNTIRIYGDINFGCSKHMASVVLAAQTKHPTIRSALNITYSKETIQRCKKIGFTIASFDRNKEPTTAPSTMEWGTQQAIKKTTHTPDIIYDKGDIGKEPMIRILGTKPTDIIQKISHIRRK